MIVINKIIFERKFEIETISQIIDKREYYKENSNDGIVILLNGSWGSGKTEFLHQLKDHINIKGEYKILSEYNAWENDFYENPHIPFFASIEKIAKLGEEADKLLEATNVVLKKEIFNFVFNISKSIIKNKLGIDSDNIKAIEDKVIEEFKKDTKYLENYSNFDKIKKIVNKKLETLCTVQPMIFIVDELDRCNPKFAIETLEIVKHFFDITNCIFIIAVDKQQLSESVKTIFGQGMNTDIYFSKFFDYQFDLMSIDVTDTFELTPFTKNDIVDADLKKYIKESFKKLNISIRDAKKIYNVFIDMLVRVDSITFLQAKVIFFMVVLKYTDLLCYRMLIDNKLKDYLAIQIDAKNQRCMNYDEYISLNVELVLFVDIIGRKDYDYLSRTYKKQFAKEYYGVEKTDVERYYDNDYDFRATQQLYKYIPTIDSDNEKSFKEIIHRILN